MILLFNFKINLNESPKKNDSKNTINAITIYQNISRPETCNSDANTNIYLYAKYLAET